LLETSNKPVVLNQQQGGCAERAKKCYSTGDAGQACKRSSLLTGQNGDMASDLEKHSIELKAELNALETLFVFLEEACAALSVPVEVQRALELSADEAVTNIINYAYPDEVPGLVRLSLHKNQGEIVLTIEDQGEPFDEAEVPDPDLEASIEDRHVGGLGVFLMHKMMDRVERSRKGDTNHLVLAKKI
jgi:anti-sigma regulatory factor (Ser/Thr protein kinase)